MDINGKQDNRYKQKREDQIAQEFVIDTDKVLFDKKIKWSSQRADQGSDLAVLSDLKRVLHVFLDTQNSGNRRIKRHATAS